MTTQAKSAFPVRLRSLREAAGLSVAALAEAAGLTRQMIRYLEIGERTPSLDTLRRLATALGEKSLACWD